MIFKHLSLFRVAVVCLQLIAVAMGIASLFFPLYRKSDSDYDYVAKVFIFNMKNTTTTSSGDYTTETSLGDYKCGLAKDLFISIGVMCILGMVSGVVGTFLAVGHLFYRPKFGCCMAIMASALLSFMMMEGCCVLAIYMYNTRMCLEAEEWGSWNSQDYSLGVSVYLMVVSCVVFLVSVVLETCS